MKYAYPACFYKSENGYSVLFADFECATQGVDLAEAISMASEAAAGWIIGSIEQGETLPEASELEMIQPEDGGFVSLISIDLKAYEAQPGGILESRRA
jgi:predicted RNase H-like HicB family nuclease